MKGLLIKDIYNLKKTISMYFVIVALLISYCIFTKKNAFLPIVPVLIFSTMITGSFTKDNSTKWDRLAVTMPLTRKNIVWSRYILFFIILAVGSIIGVIAMMFPIMKGSVNIVTEMELLLFGMIISMFSGGVSMLLLFSIQSIVDKVELVTVISYLLGAGISLGIVHLLNIIIKTKVLGLFAGIVSAFVFLFASCMISVAAFSKRDLE